MPRVWYPWSSIRMGDGIAGGELLSLSKQTRTGGKRADRITQSRIRTGSLALGAVKVSVLKRLD